MLEKGIVLEISCYLGCINRGHFRLQMFNCNGPLQVWVHSMHDVTVFWLMHGSDISAGLFGTFYVKYGVFRLLLSDRR